jgi:hypothetical protein
MDSAFSELLEFLRLAKYHGPDREESIGPLAGSFNGRLCYKAKGPVRECYEKIAPLIHEHLKHHALIIGNSDFLRFEIYMIGISPRTSRPKIMFACPKKKPRVKALELLRKSKILLSAPGFEAGEWKFPPDIRNPELLSGEKDAKNMKETSSISATRVSVVDSNTGAEVAKCTIGAVIQLPGSENYSYFTAKHPYKDTSNADSESETSQNDSEDDDDYDDEECDFGDELPENLYEFGGNLLQNEITDADELHFNTMSAASRTASIESSFVHYESGDDSLSNGDKPQSTQYQCSHADDMNEHGAEISSDSNVSRESRQDISSITLKFSKSDIILSSADLDYALINAGPLRTITNSISGHDVVQTEAGNIVIRPEMASGPLTEDVPVIAVTASNGVIPGVLSATSSYIKFPGTLGLQQAYVVTFEGPLERGDSGSCVFGPQYDVVYGHIVAGSTSSQVAYVIPARKTFHDLALAAIPAAVEVAGVYPELAAPSKEVSEENGSNSSSDKSAQLLNCSRCLKTTLTVNSNLREVGHSFSHCHHLDPLKSRHMDVDVVPKSLTRHQSRRTYAAVVKGSASQQPMGERISTTEESIHAIAPNVRLKGSDMTSSDGVIINTLRSFRKPIFWIDPHEAHPWVNWRSIDAKPQRDTSKQAILGVSWQDNIASASMAADSKIGRRSFATPFSYASLSTSPREIRLLKLTSADPSRPLEVELEENVPLWEAANQYTALSYRRHDKGSRRKIYINGKSHQVSECLIEALLETHSIMDKTSNRGSYLWVEELCVNQGDAEEVSHQNFMARDIYRLASRKLDCLVAKETCSEITHRSLSHLPQPQANLPRLPSDWLINAHSPQRSRGFIISDYYPSIAVPMVAKPFSFDLNSRLVYGPAGSTSDSGHNNSLRSLHLDSEDADDRCWNSLSYLGSSFSFSDEFQYSAPEISQQEIIHTPQRIPQQFPSLLETQSSLGHFPTSTNPWRTGILMPEQREHTTYIRKITAFKFCAKCNISFSVLKDYCRHLSEQPEESVDMTLNSNASPIESSRWTSFPLVDSSIGHGNNFLFYVPPTPSLCITSPIVFTSLNYFPGLHFSEHFYNSLPFSFQDSELRRIRDLVHASLGSGRNINQSQHSLGVSGWLLSKNHQFSSIGIQHRCPGTPLPWEFTWEIKTYVRIDNCLRHLSIRKFITR